MDNYSASKKSDRIKSKLKDAYDLLHKRALLSRLLWASSIFALSIILMIVSEDIFFLDSTTKIIWLISSVVLFSFIFFIFGNRSSADSFPDFYHSFARSEDLNELSYYLDLEQNDTGDKELVEAALESNLSTIDSEKFEQKLSSFVKGKPTTELFTRSYRFFGASLVLLILLGFTFSEAVLRSIQFWESFQKPNPYSFTISPGNSTQEQGSPFSASISFSGDIPDDLSLLVKTEVENEFRSLNMDRTSDGFSSIPFNLNNNMNYYVEMDGFRSEIYSADVQLRPRFSELNAVIISPDYTKLDSSVQSYPFSLVRAYQGSDIRLSGSLNKDVSVLSLLDLSGEIDTLEITDKDLNYSFTVSERDTISFTMEDKNGLQNSNPFQFVIEPQIDEYPFVELIEPNNSFEMVEPKKLDLTFKATDDFDITRGKLVYELRKAYVEEPTSGSINLPKPSNGVLQRFNWDLTALELSPLDELTFWVEATDNDGYNGRKTSKSAEIILTVPSLVDYFESLDKKEDEVESDLENISESFEELSETYKEFEESLKENPNPDYENKRQLEEAEKKQQEVQEKIDQLNEKFEEIKKELSENNLLSEETQKTYEEFKKLMEEIDDPSLQEALQKLRENLDQMTPEQLRRAMEDVEFNEEDYRKRLERTIELFKQLKLMSDMEKLAKSFEDQARQEQELSENPPSEQEAENKRKEDLNQIDKMKEALDELSENASEKNEESVSKFQEETVKELEENITKKIEEWLKEQEEKSGENSEGNSNESGDNQDQNSQPQNQQQQQNQQPNLKQEFENLANKAREAMKSMGGQQQQINIAGLQYVLSSLLMLSTEQEDLVYLTQETDDRSLGYIELARDQRNVEQIYKSISDSLFELSKTIPQFSNQVNTKSAELERRLERSLSQMAERNQRNSSVASRQAFGGINEIAFMIANLLEQLQNQQNSGQGGSGNMSLQQMMEQMGEMRGNQQQLNQQLQQMINDMQGERLSQDQMERLDQIAKQQNRIRQQMEEIRNNGGIEGDRLGSEIERMINEMEDTINDLRGGAVDPTLVERQQNILTRILDAERSMQERDEEENEREAQRPDNFNRANPPEMTLEELEKQIRARLNDPNFTKYSPDYQRLIERYFELLKQLQERGS